jgi:hypothetical protein
MSIEHINPEGMLKSTAFSQGISVPGNARLLVIGGQNGVDSSGLRRVDGAVGPEAETAGDHRAPRRRPRHVSGCPDRDRQRGFGRAGLQ